MRDRVRELAATAARPPTPEEGLAAIAALRGLLDSLEAAHVDRAMRAGASWSRVAGALGVSKQAAHAKHARRVRERGDASADRRRLVVTGQARRSVASAREEAEALGQRAIGTEFLLLGLLRDPRGAPAQVLTPLGATLQSARAQVERMLASGQVDVGSGSTGAKRLLVGSLPLSRRAQAALEQSLREALRRGDAHLGAEHILLALLREEEGGAVRALAGLGLAPDEVERRLSTVLRAGGFAPAAAA